MDQEKVVTDWITQTTQNNVLIVVGSSGVSLCEQLKSGVALCKLVNYIKPNTIKKINTTNSLFAQRENLIAFGKACESMGIIEGSSKIHEFILDDKDHLVVKYLYSLMKLNSTATTASVASGGPPKKDPPQPSTSPSKSPAFIKRAPLPTPTTPPFTTSSSSLNVSYKFNNNNNNNTNTTTTTNNNNTASSPPQYPAPTISKFGANPTTGLPRKMVKQESYDSLESHINRNLNGTSATAASSAINNNSNNSPINSSDELFEEVKPINSYPSAISSPPPSNPLNSSTGYSKPQPPVPPPRAKGMTLSHPIDFENEPSLNGEHEESSPRQHLQTSLSAPSLINDSITSSESNNCNNSQTSSSSQQSHSATNNNLTNSTSPVTNNTTKPTNNRFSTSYTIPIVNRDRDHYGTMIAGSPPMYVDAYSNSNTSPGATVTKKPRSSTKHSLAKFFSKSSSTSKSSKQLPQNAPPSPSSSSSSPSLNSINNSNSASCSKLKSGTLSSSSSGPRNITKPTNSSPDLLSGDDYDELTSSGDRGAEASALSASGGYDEYEYQGAEEDISNEELMNVIKQVEFLYKDRKIIKERINFTYPEKYKSFMMYDELLELDRSPTFVNSAFVALTPRQQYEVCKREERRMLSEIFTLNNVLNIVEENKALAIRVEEYQKMVDSLMVDKKSLTARFDEMLAAKAKSEKHQIEEEGIIFSSELNGKMEIIKGGTTEKLIERLYNKNIIGSVSDYVDTFLLTYRSFTTSKFVLERLTKTYNDNTATSEEGADSEKQFQVEQENLGKKKIRLRICNFLKRWVDFFFHDFDTELLQEYDTFISNCKDEKLNNLLRRALDKKVTGVNITKLTTFGTKPPPPILPKMPINSFDDVDPTELARQLTLIEYDLFRSIASKELLSLSWQKSDKEKRSPNLLKMIHRFNEVSNWVVVTLVKENNVKKRGQHLKRFIKLCEELRKLNNFNCCFVVVSALLSASVNRLQKTWSELSKQQQKQFDEFVALTSPNLSFSAYREEIHNANPPCIPYLGVHLSDLTFIEEGNPDKLENGFVNFFKCRMVAEVIKEIQRYQQQPYNLQSVPEVVTSLINNHKIITESDCFKLSLIAEPRDASLTSS